MPPCIAALDVGTTSVKACLFTPELELIACCVQEYALDARGAWVEARPETYLAAARDAMYAALAAAPGHRPEALGLCTQGETMVPADAQGQALRPFLVWLDGRAGAQAAELKKAHDREAQAQFSNDLKTIRAAYPDEKAQKVEELGIEFLKLCAGGISPLVAYEAIRNEKARSAANPPSMGDVKTSPTTEKEFFTRAEVAAMDQATVSRYFDKIRKSQQYWK